MEDSIEYISKRLKDDARSHDRMRMIRCVLWFVTAVVSLLMLSATLDYWTYNPQWRWLFPSLSVAGLTVAGWCLWRILRCPESRKSRALEIEKGGSGHGCLISTSVDYLNQPDDLCDDSRELRQRLHESAASQLKKKEVKVFDSLRVPVVAMIAAFMGLTAFMLLVPQANVSFARAFQPSKNIPYTTMQVNPGDVVIPFGSELEIATAWMGRRPGHSLLEWRDSGTEAWSQEQLTSNAGPSLISRLQNLKKDTEYRIRMDESESPVYSVDVYTPPALGNTRIVIHPPEYTGKPAFTIETPDLLILRGSRLELAFFCSDSIATAHLRFEDGTRIPLQYETGAWRAGMVVHEDRNYWLELADHAGRKGGNQNPFEMTVLPDERPRLRIIEPGTDIRARADDVITIRFDAEDDYGIAALQLRYKTMGGKEIILPYSLTDDHPDKLTGNISLDLKPLDLGEYDVIYYYLHVEDNNTLDGSGMSDTPVYFIEITDKQTPLSNCNTQGPVETYNVLIMEKQIIAQTVETAPDDHPSFPNLSRRQEMTLEMCQLFAQSEAIVNAPELARFEFIAAQLAMKQAIRHFNEKSRDAALGSAEKALAHLYETARFLPDSNSICSGTSITLKVIEEKINKEKQDLDRELQSLINRANNILETENDWLKRLLQILGETNPTPGSSGTNASGQIGVNSALPTLQQPNSNSNPTPNQNERMSDRNADLAELSEEQKAIAAKMAELAEGLGNLSNRDERIPPIFSEDVKRAAGDIAMSSSGMEKNPGHGPGYARRGIMVLGAVIDALESLHSGEMAPTVVDVQLYPQKYERLISEYLKELSFAE